MVELLISLVRNAACVLKSLLPVEYAVMQPLMSFPFPAFLSLGASQQPQQQQLEMFTGLEGLIGLLQLAGAGFNLCKGAKALAGGVVTAEYIVRWRNALAEYEMGVEGTARGVDSLTAVLGRQDAANNRRIIAGICQLVIGTGLLCLTCFSWKLVGVMTTATAVAILEVALAVLLAIGITGVLRMWAISNKVQGMKRKEKQEKAVPAAAAPDADVVELIAPHSGSDLGKWEPDVRMPPTVGTLREHMQGMSSIEKAVADSPLEDYQAIGQAAKKQAMLDAFLILLNVAAFVGYGTIPLDVFFPQRSLLTDWLPPGPTAWWGNFVGDVAWTIEPVTVFLAPYLLLRRAQPNLATKRKTS